MNGKERFLSRAEKFADILLGAGGFLSLCALGLVFYEYTWTGRRQFFSVSSLLIYYGVPLAAAIVLLGCLRLSRALKLNVLLLCATLGLLLPVGELFVRTYSALHPPPLPAMIQMELSKDKEGFAAQLTQKFGVKIDTRSAAAVIADLKAQGINAVPIVTPSNHVFVPQNDGSIKSAIEIDGREVMPLAAISEKPTVLCNEDGQYIEYKSDEHGFNNPEGIWELDHLDIAAVGDSFTHGYCVPSDKDFVSLIRDRYPATLNLGMSGDGPLLMLAKVREYLRPLKPKTVLWFYYEGNDLTDLQAERKSAVLRGYLNSAFTQPELHRQRDLDEALMGRARTMMRVPAAKRSQGPAALAMGKLAEFTAFAKLPELRTKLGLVNDAPSGRQVLADLEGPNMTVFQDALSQTKAEVESWGGQLYFIYLPEWARYNSYTSYGKTKRAEVIKIVDDLHVPIIDIDPVFRATGDPLALFPFRELGHYTEAGHKLVADEVLRVLSESSAINQNLAAQRLIH